VVEGRLVVTAVVQDIAEVDARFGVVVVELQRAPEGRDRRVVVAETVLRVADQRYSLCGLGRLFDGNVEELFRLVDHPLAKEGASDL